MQSDAIPSTSKNTIDPELFQKIQPAEYLSRFIAEGYRPDGRRFDEFRTPSVNVGSISSADGSALVRIGETSVLCGIRAEIAQPDILAPNSGFFVPNIDLPPMCSSRFRPGPPSEEAQVLSHRLRNIALSSNLVPLRSLCIKPGKAAWVIYADLICLNYDGNVIDAALLALLEALRNTRIPKAVWNEDLDEAVAIAGDLVPLRTRATVLCASFGVTASGQLLSDPSSFEAPLCITHLTIALDQHGKIRHVWQAGPGARDPAAPASLLVRCLALSRERWKSLQTSLQ